MHATVPNTIVSHDIIRSLKTSLMVIEKLSITVVHDRNYCAARKMLSS